MKLIKRLTTSISASLDTAVGQIENHDAIVDATIKQTRQAVAKTQARINTLRQQQNSYDKQLTESRKQHAIWEERATNLAETDRDKALQCVSRRNQFSVESNRLVVLLEQQKELIRGVSSNLRKLQDKLDEMTQKHNLMRSRQTVADVNRAVSRADHDNNLHDTFERWESAVLEHEIAVSDTTSRDTLEIELSEQESEAELLIQLGELTGDTKTESPAEQSEKGHE